MILSPCPLALSERQREEWWSPGCGGRRNGELSEIAPRFSEAADSLRDDCSEEPRTVLKTRVTGGWEGSCACDEYVYGSVMFHRSVLKCKISQSYTLNTDSFAYQSHFRKVVNNLSIPGGSLNLK